MLKRILLGLVAVLVILQFFRIDKTNPPLDQPNDFITQTNPPQEIAALLKDACYDCHSHETKYPWYTNIAPVSWWIKDHIDEAREHLNFSIWGTYEAKKRAHKLEECYEEVEEKHMPLKSYTWMHPEAKLDESQRSKLVKWFKAREGQEKLAKPAPPTTIEKKGDEM